MSAGFPDYYDILHCDPSSTEAQIRTAYKKQSLLTHPDRLKNATEAQRAEATKKFQTVADAYYVLSDPGRRRAYDAQRSSRRSGPSSSSTGAGGFSGFPGGFAGFDNSDSASANFFSQFFGKGGPGAQFADEDTQSSFGGSESSSTGARPNAEHVFGDVFEELLTPEVERVVPFWRWAGTGAGVVLGYIIGNLPGAALGAYAGGKVGSVRDAKGKAVATVFAELGGDQKAQILQALLAKVIGSATGR